MNLKRNIMNWLKEFIRFENEKNKHSYKCLIQDLNIYCKWNIFKLGDNESKTKIRFISVGDVIITEIFLNLFISISYAFKINSFSYSKTNNDFKGSFILQIICNSCYKRDLVCKDVM